MRERDRLRRLLTHPTPPPRTGRCETCLTEFTTRRPNRRFCADSCRERSRYDAGRRPITAGQKRRVLERDGWRCYICGSGIDRDARWPAARAATVDHFIPRAAGGPDTDANLRAAHWACNEEKGDKLPSEIWIAA